MREHGTAEQQAILSPWPVARPENWPEQVNALITAKEQDIWRASLERSRPFGDASWINRTVVKLGLEHTIRREGRPVQAKEDDAKVNWRRPVALARIVCASPHRRPLARTNPRAGVQ